LTSGERRRTIRYQQKQTGKEMSFKYRIDVRYHQDKIEKIEIDSETDKTVTIKFKDSFNGKFCLQRLHKNSTGYFICDSWREAHNKLKEIANARKEWAMRESERRIKEFEDVMCMEEPTL
jgi:hypothetical protein